MDEVDQRSKIKYYLRVTFGFLGIGVCNSYIIYVKLQAAEAIMPALTSL